MKIFRSPVEMTAWSNNAVKAGKNIGFVPTMGCFHEGHLSLMRMARNLADHVVVSLFVNPAQFGPEEDYKRYPRVFEKDCRLAEKEGVDVLFSPDARSIYPDNYQTTVSVGVLTKRHCGQSRPGHFDGVTTVVAKLFHIVKPHFAVFGAKDFQQLTVIRQMVLDLNWDVKIVEHPIVREKDGLAMSSRNIYLSAKERASALALSGLISDVKKLVADGETVVGTLLDLGREKLARDKAVVLEYLEIVNDSTLLSQDRVDTHSVLLLAARIGKTRLIDNGRLLS